MAIQEMSNYEPTLEQLDGARAFTHDLPDAVSFRISEIVLKVAEGCNIACDYCYMYEAADQSYKGRPAFMSEEIVDAVATNMGMYAGPYQVGAYTLLFHGGEPLL